MVGIASEDCASAAITTGDAVLDGALASGEEAFGEEMSTGRFACTPLVEMAKGSKKGVEDGGWFWALARGAAAV